MSVLAVVVRRLRDTDEMASDLAFLDVGGRLAKKLLELAATNGVKRQDGVLLDMPITQEELANMIGVTRESVNRNLSLFRRIGLVAKEGRRFVLRDPVGLRRRCE
jgi:CRP-like cAMP-binding protein